MSTSPKNNRPKRSIIKPLRYQTTSSDEVETTNTGQQKGQQTGIEEDVRELREIFNDSFDNSNSKNTYDLFISPETHNVHLHKLQEHTPTQYEPSHNFHLHELQTRTQLSKTNNQYTLQKPTPVESYSHSSFTQYVPTTCTTTYTSNQYPTSNDTNKRFQVYSSNIDDHRTYTRTVLEHNKENR